MKTEAPPTLVSESGAGQALSGWILRTNSPWLPAAFPHATRGDCQHREPTSAGEPLRVCRPFWEAVRPGRKTAPRAPPPQPFPDPGPVLSPRLQPGSGVSCAPHLFQRRHQQPPPLGRVLLAEKLVRQLLRLHGAPGAPPGGERGGGGRAGEPREGELVARNRAAVPPDGPAPLGRRAAGLAPERGLGGEARARPPTRHRHQPRKANAARRRRRRHPAPPPRGRAPLPLPGPPAPPRVALRRRPGLPSAAVTARPPGLRSRARPGPAAEPAAGGGLWRDAPAPAPAPRGTDPETLATWGGAELGAGSSGGGGRPEVVVGESGCPETPPRPPPTPV